jgi:hypothetical protein
MPTLHCVDTCSFITMKHYPRDLFDPLWSFIEELIGTGRLLAPNEVLRELSKRDDDIFKWAKTQKNAFVELESAK